MVEDKCFPCSLGDFGDLGEHPECVILRDEGLNVFGIEREVTIDEILDHPQLGGCGLKVGHFDTRNMDFLGAASRATKGGVARFIQYPPAVELRSQVF